MKKWIRAIFYLNNAYLYLHHSPMTRYLWPEAFMQHILITWPPMSSCHLITRISDISLIISVCSSLTEPHPEQTGVCECVCAHRSARRAGRCSGWWSAPPNSPCSRSSSSFLQRRTSGAPWPAAGLWWYPLRRAAAAAAAGAGGPQDQLSCRRGRLGPVCMSGGVGNISAKRRPKKKALPLLLLL